jgi:hypothetical protein
VGAPGYSYALDVTAELSLPTDWTAEATNLALAPSVLFTNSATSSRAFFRIRYVP